ncbi:MAG: M23 family metallopeptidase [Clostridia bacterium]|nr:M23 family metallopeptidase [Clostridia bacterium]
MILTIILIKYKPAYAVTMSGELLGFVEDKDFINNKLDKYMNDTSRNIAFREIEALPEYSYTFVSRGKELLEDRNILLAIENTTNTTYRVFAITIDGEQTAVVDTEENAEEIINELKKDVDSKIDLKLGIAEIYTQEPNTSAKDEVLKELNIVKTALINENTKPKKESSNIKQITSVAKMDLSIPVRGTITSRFGSRSSIRSSAHTGLDIGTSKGTAITAIAPGTVTYAGTKGAYGKLVIIDHGNGIESYYAHCNKIYVSVGEEVDSNTKISAVGSTGNSTGPHLHLEIRVNGKPVNPQNYLY